MKVVLHHGSIVSALSTDIDFTYSTYVQNQDLLRDVTMLQQLGYNDQSRSVPIVSYRTPTLPNNLFWMKNSISLI